jgi:hypothetical protein
MVVMKKYSEAISQERIVGNGSLKELFPAYHAVSLAKV